MVKPRLVLVLGDQLTTEIAALRALQTIYHRRSHKARSFPKEDESPSSKALCQRLAGRWTSAAIPN